jgi:1,4-alpha-glucan branching enzyme
MSGMPGMCLHIADGGIGFDYRLSMGVPDFWIKMLRDKNDEDWDMWHMWHELTTRRPMEKSIGYAESHDQALVGDKTLIFWLADKEMYWHMMKNDGNMIIERSIALHKMIRFLTLILAGEGYLNFIGNEFGHPEWVDFPRQGNNWSYKYAKRQWSLVDNENLRYDYLNNFDREMLTFVKTYNVLGALDLHSLWIDNNENIIVFRKGGLIFLFNFHPTNSFPEYGIPTHEAGEYQVVFNSDRDIFGGFSRIPQDIIYKTRKLPDKGNSDGVVLYSPSRTVLVIKKI